MAQAPALFRLILQVDDLDRASEFYAKLLDDPGRRIPRASRHYIDCGPVILALVDVTAGGEVHVNANVRTSGSLEAFSGSGSKFIIAAGKSISFK